jgi:hypothetical protein
MVMFSSDISQQIYASQLMMMQHQQQARMLSQQMGTMPQMSALGTSPGYAGVYGEQVANRMVGGARMMGGMAGVGMGVMGAMTGLPLDPFSAAWSMGKLGWAGGAGGFGGAIGGAALGAAPFLAAGKIASVYGGAFTGGMHEQASLNSTLRGNFNFQGGQGAFGRGFSQQQMGQIGSTVSSEMRQFPYTSSQEMNQLVSSGADSGMFTAVRDVQQFSQRFKTMIDGLRKIQKELGGTLSDAMAFTRGSQQLGMFSSGQRTAFASELRDTMASTGMDQQQAFSLAATGSMLSRATGGLGRQGAMGAMRTARQLGAAMSSGAIDMESLSAATGGLTGTEAVSAFSTRMLQLTDRSSRTAAGRYGLFALSNAKGTGLDQDMLDRFRSGDISVSDVMGTAHRNVNQMGRARALNSEGRLRGALMEEGGLSGKLGEMRMRLGDRALDGGDDLAQLVIQRKMGVSREEATVLTSLMRNQRSIARQEDLDSSLSQGQVGRQRDASMRGLDSFMANLEHGMQDVTGVTATRELGRKFLTRVSAAAERTMNEFLGTQASALTNSDRSAIARVSMGMGTAADRERMRNFSGGGPASGTDAFGTPLATRTLRSLSDATSGLMHFDGQLSIGELMTKRGVNFGSMSSRQREASINAAGLAQSGVVFGSDRTQLDALLADKAGTRRSLLMGELGGGAEGIYRRLRGTASANAADAAAGELGFALPRGLNPDEAMGLQDTNGSTGLERVLASTRRGAGVGAERGLRTGNALGTYAGVGLGALYGAGQGIFNEVYDSRERALGYISRGGHVGEFGRSAAETMSNAVRGGVNVRGTLASLNKEAEKRGTTLTDAMAIGNASRSSLLGRNGIDRESMEAVLSSDVFQSGIRNLAGGLKGDAQTAELDRLREAAVKLPEDQRKAATVAIEQLSSNLKRGGVGKEFATMVVDDKKRAEALREFGKIGGKFDSVLKQLGPNNALEESIRRAGNTYASASMGSNVDMAGSVDRIVRDLSTMDPKSEEYARASKALGSIEGGQGRAILAAGRDRAGAITQISGEGRRGRAGQADAVFGRLTGFSLGEMDLELRGHKLGRNKANVLLQSFQQGGADSEALEKQLRAQLGGMNVEKADEYVKMIKNKAQGGFTKEEAGEVYDVLSKDKDLQRVQQEGVQRSIAAAGASDPLGAQRNDILQKILEKLPAQPTEEVNQSLPPAQGKPG